MYYTLENFINYCERLEIAEEGLIDKDKRRFQETPYRYVVCNPTYKKGVTYKAFNANKLPSNPKKALLLYMNNGQEPIKVSADLEKDFNSSKIELLKLDLKALDEYGYRKIISIEKGTTDSLVKKYGIKIIIQK